MATASSSGLSSALAGGADTIVARATAAGSAALAVVRVSGPATTEVAARLSPELNVTRPWAAQLVGVDGVRAVAIPYRAPRSYTGEDMVELVVHGSPYLVSRLLDACVAAGCRLAAPGEFTRRAVANGKMDLVQAEAVRDLVRSETAAQARLAGAQLNGSLSQRLATLRGEIVALLAQVEASLDFVAQGVAVDRPDREARRAAALGDVHGLLATAATGERIRDGVRLVVSGPPNAGKSSVFNKLLKHERAIVSPHPGTTRDLIEAEVELAGMRVVVVDTAGVRRDPEPVEAEGVRRAQGAAAAAGALLWLQPVDGGPAVPPPVAAPWVGVLSKADLDPGALPPEEGPWLRLSVVTGEGWAELEERLARLVAGEDAATAGDVAIAGRHRQALVAVAEHLSRCDLGEPELAAEDLREAVEKLGELTGEVAGDEVLDAVFATFCLGK